VLTHSFVSPKSGLYASAAEPLEEQTRKSQVYRVHPDFRVIAMGNRPGYPFLGNDFFAEMGDVFACHAIDNPDQRSEIELLHSYAPDVGLDILQRLTAAFADLRQMNEDGIIVYPYSTRELVNIVKHIQRFPEDSMSSVLHNVFAFDSFDVELHKTLLEVFPTPHPQQHHTLIPE